MLSIQSFTYNQFRERTYILYNIETKDTIIIDPGCTTNEEQQELFNFIEQEGLHPMLLLNTHCHLDHMFGSNFVYITYGIAPRFHKLEIPVFNNTIQSTKFNSPNANYNFPKPVFDIEKTNFINSNEKISLGDDIIEAIHCPGHTPGHLAFYSRSQNFIIGGDALFFETIGRTDIPLSNQTQLIASIRQSLLSLPEETVVYPGHGKNTTIAHEKNNNPFLQ